MIWLPWNSKCDVCKAAFAQKRDLIWHQMIHTGGKPYERTQKDELYTCDLWRVTSVLHTQNYWTNFADTWVWVQWFKGTLVFWFSRIIDYIFMRNYEHVWKEHKCFMSCYNSCKIILSGSPTWPFLWLFPGDIPSKTQNLKKSNY